MRYVWRDGWGYFVYSVMFVLSHVVVYSVVWLSIFSCYSNDIHRCTWNTPGVQQALSRDFILFLKYKQ